MKLTDEEVKNILEKVKRNVSWFNVQKGNLINPEEYNPEPLMLALDELLALREATRWRKYPEEKPEEGQWFLQIGENGTAEVHCYWEKGLVVMSVAMLWRHLKYWLPIPPIGDTND